MTCSCVTCSDERGRMIYAHIVPRMRGRGYSHSDIAFQLGLTRSEVRRFLDPKAQRAHDRWNGRGE